MKIYPAGKIWHAPKFQSLRDDLGFPIKARWIDLKDDSDIVQNRKDELWKQCYEDVRDCDFLVLYAEEFEEEQRGAIVEVGMAYGMGKPVYAIGKCKTTAPNAISDVAFTYYHLWEWLEAADIVEGFLEAISIEQRKQRINLQKHSIGA